MGPGGGGGGVWGKKGWGYRRSQRVIIGTSLMMVMMGVDEATSCRIELLQWAPCRYPNIYWMNRQACLRSLRETGVTKPARNVAEAHPNQKHIKV